MGRPANGRSLPGVSVLRRHGCSSFDVGTDSKSPAGDYPRNHALNGKIGQVIVDLK